LRLKNTPRNCAEPQSVLKIRWIFMVFFMDIFGGNRPDIRHDVLPLQICRTICRTMGAHNGGDKFRQQFNQDHPGAFVGQFPWQFPANVIPAFPGTISGINSGNLRGGLSSGILGLPISIPNKTYKQTNNLAQNENNSCVFLIFVTDCWK
jgi:hypothetical protein